ncbi:hypothetical protein A6P39_019415 [Streptomyces sp. FXJ1.172]|uniref:hypothetical protein n=1 Tax=Streptomyces sp. FXJ1.172 TaxID=710705 RepID=UPI0007CF7C36|nr:hypothetical protein [Streptomyces sp. FXJ1.172]WEO96029.1 hypothetical protein A6P39_019415 [Streptomyces sp. FXJ1.172]
MGNTFYGGGDGLYLSNGGTAAFVDVLMLAVSDLVEEPWDYRFAALLALQDQNVMGRGAVGFDLEDIDWGASPEEQARNKDFVLRVTDLALNRHRWDELDYNPAFAADYLRRFRAMVAAYTPASRGDGSPMAFPCHEEAAMASCAHHRVLSALPHWEGCVLCTARQR